MHEVDVISRIRGNRREIDDAAGDARLVGEVDLLAVQVDEGREEGCVGEAVRFGDGLEDAVSIGDRVWIHAATEMACMMDNGGSSVRLTVNPGMMPSGGLPSLLKGLTGESSSSCRKIALPLLS